jgi:GNAT superfamily N-acetyltransferase
MDGQMTNVSNSSVISIRAMTEADVAEATAIFQVAFGTFIGLPDPTRFAADRNYIAARRRAEPDAAFVAEIDGRLAGSNLATRWGSFGYFGPLSVRPELWDRGVGKELMARTVDLLDRWQLRESGLFTFPHSPKHIGFYQKFGYWPRFLTALMVTPAQKRSAEGLRFSALDIARRDQAERACRELTNSIYDGLDVTFEIRLVFDQKMGDTVLIWSGDRLDAFAVCHCGAGTEAGGGSCYVKFAAVRPGAHAQTAFDQVLSACETLASERGLERLSAGVNTYRSDAYRHLLRRGYRANMYGIAMHRPNLPAYNRPDVYVLDDWR